MLDSQGYGDEHVARGKFHRRLAETCKILAAQAAVVSTCSGLADVNSTSLSFAKVWKACTSVWNGTASVGWPDFRSDSINDFCIDSAVNALLLPVLNPTI